VEGVNFLYGLYAKECGGILADDMGLGKTVQSIAFMSAVLQKAKKEVVGRKPCILVVTPASVMTQWVNGMPEGVPLVRITLCQRWKSGELLLEDSRSCSTTGMRTRETERE
jgi:SNF2 family DNA or RNA helicase